MFLKFVFVYTAEISFDSKLGNVTYWSPGSTVTLPWTHNFGRSDIRLIIWIFSKPGSSETLAQDSIVSRRVIIDHSKVDITGQATLVLKNAEIADNGTYTYYMYNFHYLLFQHS